MVSVNPFADFRSACEAVLQAAFRKLPTAIPVPLGFESPPNPEFGELASSVCFELGKLTGRKPIELAQEIAEITDLSDFPLLGGVKAAGSGYVNFFVNLAAFAKLALESVISLDDQFGFVKTEKPLKIIVEHTSANPAHPIHIGTARNPVLGDSLARILKARGHVVYRHYYVDDVGRQSAVLGYGYEKLGQPEPEGKPDHFTGAIYSITSCLVEIQKLKKLVENAKLRAQNADELSQQTKELDEWAAVATELESTHPQIFGKLLDKISHDENPDEKVAMLNLGYERGEPGAIQLIRKVSELCLKGLKQSLNRLSICHDSWDWESDFVWNSYVRKILNQLEKTPYIYRAGQVLEFDSEKAAQVFSLKPLLGLREDYEIPSLTLIRADGSTLYTTRDIAYNLWKFQRADLLVNVIGMEQTLAQIQLKTALAALGHLEEVKNLQHFAYNLVRLPGSRMSGRTGRYITLDETMDEAVKRAYDEVVKRSPTLSEEEKQRISNFVGLGAIKYALVQVDPSKPVVFTWDRVLNFEKNSAPYIQYTYARAGSILRKAEEKPENPNYELLTASIEREIILALSRLPDIFIDCAENLRPNEIADYANLLADKFNTFYNALPVIKAKPAELRDARIALVKATKIVLNNALNLLGIEAPERM
jgi:arginyl-tRNA synthetase